MKISHAFPPSSVSGDHLEKFRTFSVFCLLDFFPPTAFCRGHGYELPSSPFPASGRPTLLGPRLIDLDYVAVSSTKPCVHTDPSRGLFTSCNISVLFSEPRLFPTRMPGDMALYLCFRLHHCLCGTLNMVIVSREVFACTTASTFGGPCSRSIGKRSYIF